LLCCIVSTFFAEKTTAGQSLYGFSGLVTVPTAEMLNDRDMIWGYGYFPRDYSALCTHERGENLYYISLQYLPFLETTWGVAKPDHFGKKWGIGDRFALFRFRLITERAKRPAIVLGLHEPYGVVGEDWGHHYCALYLVGSKSFSIPIAQTMSIHCGYGVDWLPAADHHFVGLFGGVKLEANKFISAMADYDTKKINLGARLNLLSHFQILIAWLNCKVWSGGMSFSFKL
jgi:hypothetical protein